MRHIVWHGNSREVVRHFPEAIRKDIGAELMLLQLGETPVHSRPMPSVGRGVWEIRVRDDRNHYRVIYIVKKREAMHVLHAFVKKSQKTARMDIELAKQRLKGV